MRPHEAARTHIACREKLAGIYRGIHGRFVGKSFLNVTVTGLAPSIKGRIMVQVVCICGTQFTIRPRALNHHRQKRVPCPSCGPKSCPTKNTYRSMLKRHRERSIPICARWRKSYDAFLEDMGLRPPRMILDRIKNKRGYKPSNCRWASYKLSTENRSNTVWLNHAGKKFRVNELAELLKIPPSRIYLRLARGWSVAQIVARPKRMSGFDRYGVSTRQ